MMFPHLDTRTQKISAPAPQLKNVVNARHVPIRNSKALAVDIADFKARLLTQLQANATLSAIQVTYADPGGAQRRECVFLGNIETDDHVPESLAQGRRRRREDDRKD